jgi:hypothetical protein
MWKQILKALKKQDEISITFPVEGRMVTMKTIQGGQPWGRDMLIQVRVEDCGFSWLQTFETLEEARKALASR